MTQRSLYECANARVRGSSIFCREGHRFLNLNDGTLNIRRLMRGNPLRLSVCRKCPDFERMGDPVPDSEKGWVKAW